MSNHFSGLGNLGQAPVLRVVQVDGEDRSVADLRVYFDRSVPQADGGFEDAGGFWLNVGLWGARAESAVQMLRKGARIQVDGQLREESWEAADGTERRALHLIASRVTVDPVCLDAVSYRQRSQPADDTSDPEHGDPS